MRVFSSIDIELTFKAIMLLQPSIATNELKSMNGEQRELFFLINSATDENFINMLADSIKSIEEKTLSSLKQHLRSMLSSKSEPSTDQKRALLFDLSNPHTNTLLWKLCDPHVPFDIWFN